MNYLQHIILSTMPWELLFIVLPMVLVYFALILRDKKRKKVRRTNL